MRPDPPEGMFDNVRHCSGMSNTRNSACRRQKGRKQAEYPLRPPSAQLEFGEVEQVEQAGQR